LASTPSWQLANPSPKRERSLPFCLKGVNVCSAAQRAIGKRLLLWGWAWEELQGICGESAIRHSRRL